MTDHQNQHLLIRSTGIIPTILTLMCFPFIARVSPVQASSPLVKKTPVIKVTDVETQSFLNRLRACVLTNWQPVDGVNTVVLEVTLATNGDILRISADKSKAMPAAIECAKNAFGAAAPIGPLPAKYQSGSQITLTFNSNVDPHGDTTSNLITSIEQINQGTALPRGAGRP